MHKTKKLNLYIYSLLLVSLTLLSIIFHFKWYTLASVLLEIACIMLLANRNIISIFLKLLCDLLYVIVAYDTKYFGDAIFYLFISTPITITSFFTWKNHIEDKLYVKPKELSNKVKYIITIISFIGIVIYSYILNLISKGTNPNPVLDACSTTTSILAYLFMMLRYKEQWSMWLLQYTITVFMYITSFDFLMIFSSIFCICSCIFGDQKWKKNIENETDFHLKKL